MNSEKANSAFVLIVDAILVLVALRLVVFVVTQYLVGHGFEMLFLPEDRFADSLKSGMAQTSISAPLYHDPRVAEWSAQWQRYLFDNDYLKPGSSIFHSPPLSMLNLIAVAAMLLIMSPGAVIAALAALYMAGSYAVARAVQSWSKVPALIRVWPLIVLAYPSIYMLDRANFISGYTSLCVIFYIVSLCSNRLRWLGWLALALAVNMRPNVAIFAALELVGTADHWLAFRRMVISGVLSIVIGAAAFMLTIRLNPAYSLQAFFDGYALYKASYVEGIGGMAWNSSLFNLAKLLYLKLGWQPIYDPALALALNGIAIAALGLFCALAWFRRISAPRFIFAIAAICCLFTPVYGIYHVLVFVAPLIVLLVTSADSLTKPLVRRALGLIVALQAVSLIYWLVPSLGGLAVLAVLCAAFPFLCQPAGNKGRDGANIDVRLTLVCLTILAPIGDGVTDGLAVAVILSASLAWLAWVSLTTPAEGGEQQQFSQMAGH